MEDILSQMSFDEGIAMPIANEENKQYEAEVSMVKAITSALHSFPDHDIHSIEMSVTE